MVTVPLVVSMIGLVDRFVTVRWVVVSMLMVVVVGVGVARVVVVSMVVVWRWQA
jgi:hypothetical protein